MIEVADHFLGRSILHVNAGGPGPTHLEARAMVSAWNRAGGGGNSPLKSPAASATHPLGDLPIAADVAAIASEKLRCSGYSELAGVECDFTRGVLTLWGSVSSFYLKQVAQTAVRDVKQVEEIVNRLEVDPSR